MTTNEEFRRAIGTLIEEGTSGAVRVVLDFVDDLEQRVETAAIGPEKALASIRSCVESAVRDRDAARTESSRKTVAFAEAEGRAEAFASAATWLRMGIDDETLWPGLNGELAAAEQRVAAKEGAEG
jgi:hypothetical protein